MKNLIKFGLVSCVAVSSIFAKTVDVDALVIYSNGADAKYNGDAKSRIEHLIATTNKIYQDSKLDIKLHAVKIMKYPSLDDSKKSSEILSQIREDENIKKIRDEVGADEVIIYRPYANDGVCGIGYMNSSLKSSSTAKYAKDYTYAHVTIDCGGYVTAHEVGHNMGLGHSYKQNSKGAFSYARGHGVENNFVTVMAYTSTYNAKKIYKFSSPKLDCNGLPCGVEEGNEDEADAVKALIQTVPLLAEFREHKVDTNDNNSSNPNSNNKNILEKIKKEFLAQRAKLIKIRQELKEYRANFYQSKRAFYREYRVYKRVVKKYNTKKATYQDVVAEYKKVHSKYQEYVNSYNSYKNFYINTYKTERAKLIELWNKYKEAKRANR